MVFRKIKLALSSFCRKFDLFPTSQFIKYKKQSQFTTATGGLVSLILIIIVLILFSSRGVQTANRSIISSTLTYKIQAQPSPIDVYTDNQHGFMFAVSLYGLDLNQPNRTYFDITLTQQSYTPIFQLINYTNIALQPCTPSHFNFNQEVLTMYYKFSLNRSLCPPIGQKFQVGGRVTSSLLKRFTLNVNKCNNAINPKCLNSTDMALVQQQLGGQFTLVTPVVNTIVNPNNQDYLQTFLQDRNYFTFTPILGMRANAFIEQYSIETDVSILPYAVNKIQQINTIPQLFSTQSVMVSSDTYVSISFSKSNRSTYYNRAFNKVDDFFSYIGGLLGSALAVFFILKSYSEKAFLIDLASNILQPSKPQYSFKSFNFFYSMLISIKQFLQNLCLTLKCQKLDYFIKSMQQMDQQLDISLIIKKLTFLQQAISTILSEHQIETLYLKGKISLEDIEQLRKKHYLSDVLVNQQRNQTNMELQSDQLINSELADSNDKDVMERIKTNLVKVVKESKHKDKISTRILNKLNKETIQHIAIFDEDPIDKGNFQNLQGFQPNNQNNKTKLNQTQNMISQKGQKIQFEFITP